MIVEQNMHLNPLSGSLFDEIAEEAPQIDPIMQL